MNYSPRTWASRLVRSLKELFSKKRAILALLFGLTIACAAWLKQQDLIVPEQIFAVLEAYPILAPLLFIGLYVLMSITLVPTLPLNLGAGFLWGPIGGTILSTLGGTLGAVCAFLIARHLTGSYFSSKFNNRAWQWLHQEIEQGGWKVVAFTRINPIFSFGPLNYFFGITSIPLFTYTWATAVFLVPPALLIACIGNSIGGFTLNQSSQTLLRSILLISAAVTLVTLIKLVMKSRIHVSKPLDSTLD